MTTWPADQVVTPARDHGVRVKRKSAVADGVVELELVPVDGHHGLPSWEPGAHVDIELPVGTRQYSLCGDPAAGDRLTVAVLREPDSRGGSSFIHDELAEGDVLRVRGPRNHFALVEADSYAFIAGGIGITPLLPMIAQVEALGRPWSLLYGGRTRAGMAYAERLVAHGNRVRLQPQDEQGLLDLESVLGEPVVGRVVYTCGPEPLLKAVEGWCERWPEGSLHLERFTAKPLDPDAVRTCFEVYLAKAGLTLQVPADRSIVEVVSQAGIEVETACEEGVCGTCETTVLEGEPDHRDSVLSESEQLAGQTMMICVSRCRTPRLVLDL